MFSWMEDIGVEMYVSLILGFFALVSLALASNYYASPTHSVGMSYALGLGLALMVLTSFHVAWCHDMTLLVTNAGACLLFGLGFNALHAHPGLQPAHALYALAAASIAFAFTAVMAFTTVPTPLWSLFARRDHFSSFTVTLVFAVYAVAVALSLFLVGHLSDWHGRRPNANLPDRMPATACSHWTKAARAKDSFCRLMATD